MERPRNETTSVESETASKKITNNGCYHSRLNTLRRVKSQSSLIGSYCKVVISGRVASLRLVRVSEHAAISISHMTGHARCRIAIVTLTSASDGVQAWQQTKRRDGAAPSGPHHGVHIYVYEC